MHKPEYITSAQKSKKEKYFLFSSLFNIPTENVGTSYT